MKDSITTTLVILIALGLSACQPSQQQHADTAPTQQNETAAPSSAPPVKSTAPASAQTAKPKYHSHAALHDGASPGKPKGPVQINYQIMDPIAAGRPMRIDLDITPLIDSRQVQIQQRLQGQMRAHDPDVTQLGLSNAGQAIKHPIRVTPDADGQHYLIVQVTLTLDDGTQQSSSLTIPITVGNVKTDLKPEHPNKSYIQETPQGQPMIVLPAQEPGN